MTKAELLQKIEALGPYAAPVIVQVCTVDEDGETLTVVENLDVVGVDYDGETVFVLAAR